MSFSTYKSVSSWEENYRIETQFYFDLYYRKKPYDNTNLEAKTQTLHLL